MKEVVKTQKAFAVVTKDTRELTAFGEGDMDAYSVHFTEDDARNVVGSQPDKIVLPCEISYKTLLP